MNATSSRARPPPGTSPGGEAGGGHPPRVGFEPPPSLVPPPAHRAHRSVVLLGKTGVGKSSTGNALVAGPHGDLRAGAAGGESGGGEAARFVTKRSSKGITRECEILRCAGWVGLPDVGGSGVGDSSSGDPTVWWAIDTPGVGDDAREPEALMRDIERCVDVAPDGVDAFVLVFSAVSRAGSDEVAALEALRSRFGSPRAFLDRLVVVFTHGDHLAEDGVTLEEYLHGAPDGLAGLVAAAGGRTLLADHRAPPGSPARLAFAAGMAAALGDVAAGAAARGEGPITREHVEAAAKAREPRLGMKARRRLRQVEARRREREAGRGGGGGVFGGLFDLVAAVATVVCPPPGPKKLPNRLPDTDL